MSTPLFDALKRIDTFVLDVDGVLTNGQLLVQTDGSLLRSMNIKDGYALQLAIKKGYQVIIISGGKNDGVTRRLAGLEITNCHLGVKDKVALLHSIVAEKNILLANVLYMGDDMPDLAVMQLTGLPCCPVDACSQVKDVATYISPYKGGEGCVRDVIEKVLTLKGDWE